MENSTEEAVGPSDHVTARDAERDDAIEAMTHDMGGGEGGAGKGIGGLSHVCVIFISIQWTGSLLINTALSL